ncbi:MAG: serine/threonine protein kinase [Pirellulaceae bacterium]|nr:MAG: serine/threonine protein kinase [Pirellulaceae bacterium]
MTSNIGYLPKIIVPSSHYEMSTGHGSTTGAVRFSICSPWLVIVFFIGWLPLATCGWAADTQYFFQFRGPHGDGHVEATGLPVHWSSTDNVRWRTAIPGLGWSSPVVWGDKVFVTTAVALGEEPQPDYSLRALCLDAERGEILWDVEVFREPGASSPRIHTKNSHASPTPIAFGDRLYVHFGHMGTACLSFDGNVVWRNDTLRYPPVHGNGGSPVLWQERLLFSCDGAVDPFVVALSAGTGSVLWRTPRNTDALKKFSFSTPALIEVGGRTQLVSPGSDALCAYDPQTGREIWRVRYDGYSVVPKPVFGHGLVFFSTGYDAPEVLAVRVDGRGDVTDTHIVWRQRRGAPNTPSLLLVDHYLYMVSDRGIASCLESTTGHIVWQQRLNGNFSASPLYGDGKIYLQSEEGVGYVLQPGPEFRLLARNDLGERTLASYAVYGRRLLIRTAGHLYCIGD